MSKFKDGECPICHKPYATAESHWVQCPATHCSVCMSHCFKECPHHNHFNDKCYYKDDKKKEYFAKQEEGKK